MSFNAITVRRIGRWTEDEKTISKSLKKKRYKTFSMEKRAVRGSSRIQNGLHAPKYIPIHKALKEISDFETFPTYLLSTFVCPGRSVERMCVRASTITFQPLHHLQHCSNFFIISGFFFSLHHDGTWADIFRRGCMHRKRTCRASQFRLNGTGLICYNSISIQNPPTTQLLLSAAAKIKGLNISSLQVNEKKSFCLWWE